MKIFHKFYTRRLYRTNKLEEIVDILIPWADEVLVPNSIFLYQVASYYLRKHSSSYAPLFYKKVIASEILRLNELDDLKNSLMLAIVIAYRTYNPSKGNVSLVNWMSWKIPYELSKLVTWRITHPIEPFEEAFLPLEIDLFERTFEVDRQIGIIIKDLDLDKQTKYYYTQKAKGKHETYC